MFRQVARLTGVSRRFASVEIPDGEFVLHTFYFSN